MVSIIARPTNSVRDMVPAASGWRAMASIAAATARPSPSAGPIAPNDTAIAAAKMLTISIQFMIFSFPSCWRASFTHCAADEHHGKHREYVGLDRSDEQVERHQRNWHKQAGKRENDANDENAAHDVAEQAHDQRKGASERFDHI